MNILKTKSDAVTTLRWTREVAAIGGAVTGVTVIWGMIYFNVADATGSHFVGAVAAIVGIAVGLFIIDFSYRQNFPYVADLIVSGQAFRNWRIFLFTVFLLLLSAAQMISSGLLSWEGRKDVAEGIIRAPELQDVASIKVASDKTTSSKIREVKAQISAIDRDITRKEKEVERTHPTYMQKINSGSDKWGWYARQLSDKKDKSVGSLRQERANLSEALSELVGNQSASDRLVIESVASQNQAKLQQYSDKKERNMRFLGYFGVGCLGVVAFVSIMLSLVGYSDLEEMDMKKTKKPFRESAASAPSDKPSPEGAMPVRDTGQYDNYEMSRRQQMAEAQIEDLRRQQEVQIRQIALQREADARRNAEALRQEKERSDRLAMEKAEALRQAEEAKLLSDKRSGDLSENLSELSEELSVQIVDKGISVGCVVYGVSELSKLKDKSQKWYNRQFTSKTIKGRSDNKARWDAIKPVWEEIGATLVYNGQSVSIEGGQLKV